MKTFWGQARERGKTFFASRKCEKILVVSTLSFNNLFCRYYHFACVTNCQNLTAAVTVVEYNFSIYSEGTSNYFYLIVFLEENYYSFEDLLMRIMNILASIEKNPKLIKFHEVTESRLTSITKKCVCIVSIRWSCKSLILQHGVRYWEFFSWCQCMEINGSVTKIICRCSKSHSKNAISPLEVDAADSQITLKGIKMEEIVFHAIWVVIFKVIDNNCVWAKIRKVRKRILTVRFLSINDLKK